MPPVNVNLRKIQDIDLNNKNVLVRVDHNVVKNGQIKDPYRIDATIPTLYYINSRGGRLILMSHVGRPKDKKTGDINISGASSVKAITEYLRAKLNVDFRTPEFNQENGRGYTEMKPSMDSLLESLNKREIDGIYLPNTRWFAGEQAKGEESDLFAKELASVADVYINDAFGSWQPHTSTFDITKELPSYAGFLMQKEIENLSKIFNPQRPFTAVVAGSKFDTKVGSMNALLELADKVVMGGVMYNAYLAAKYGFEIEGVGNDDIEHAGRFVSEAEKHPGKVLELPYIIESDTLDGKKEGHYRAIDIRKLEKGARLKYILDVSPESFDVEEVKKAFESSGQFFVNAVMGMTPHFEEGTVALDTIIDKNESAIKLFGGGDTLQDMKTFAPGIYYKALNNPKYYMFTGGGAVLKAIQEGGPTGIEPVKALLEG